MEKKKKRIPRHKVYTCIAAVVVLALIGAYVFMVLHKQQKTLAELNEQRQELQEQVEYLMREQERLQSDLEFAKSLEGLLQYARDNLGYLGPDDIRIDDGK